MKNSIFALVLLISCSGTETKNQRPIKVAKASEEEWVTYEGRWISGKGIFSLELSLKEGSVGIDSEYKLDEVILAETSAGGTRSKSTYSTISGLENNELGIQLHNLQDDSPNAMLRYKNRSTGTEEMFFITRGNNELLPCDDHFQSLTTDKRYTLHKRSKLFTAEGYFSIEDGSAKFFERNTEEDWNVASLGEFDVMKKQYQILAKEKFEGIYLKALAYEVTDSAIHKLVIKRILEVKRGPGVENPK